MPICYIDDRDKTCQHIAGMSHKGNYGEKVNMLNFGRKRNVDAHKPHHRITTREIRDNFSEAIQFVSGERDTLVLTKHGEDRVAIVPLEVLWAFEEIVDDELMKLVKMGADGEALREALRERLLKSERFDDEATDQAKNTIHQEGSS